MGFGWNEARFRMHVRLSPWSAVDVWVYHPRGKEYKERNTFKMIHEFILQKCSTFSHSRPVPAIYWLLRVLWQFRKISLDSGIYMFIEEGVFQNGYIFIMHKWHPLNYVLPKVLATLYASAIINDANTEFPLLSVLGPYNSAVNVYSTHQLFLGGHIYSV